MKHTKGKRGADGASDSGFFWVFPPEGAAADYVDVAFVPSNWLGGAIDWLSMKRTVVNEISDLYSQKMGSTRGSILLRRTEVVPVV
jgi:hypothetical protein